MGACGTSPEWFSQCPLIHRKEIAKIISVPYVFFSWKIFSDLYSPRWKCFGFYVLVFLLAIVNSSQSFFFFSTWQKKSRNLYKINNSFIWARRSYSLAGYNLYSTIYFSDCCWERARKSSGTAAELSPVLQRARPRGVHCAPLRAADQVCLGHGDAYRGEWNSIKPSW